MSWQPPERPDWVRAINAGDVALVSEEAAQPFERDALLGEALARVGHADVSAFEAPGVACLSFDALVEPLDVLCSALEEEAGLHVVGRWLTRRFLLRLLEVRLQIVRALAEDPGVLDEPIERPLFVAGAPRTGTTILHAMLAADPNNRSPLGWELLRPVPPPADDPDPAARIALANRELVAPQTVVSGLLSIHAYGAHKPKECLSAMSFVFRSEEFTARYRVPGYAAWLAACDMRPAYEMHRIVLQLLQRRAPKRPRWALKSPVHLHALPTLFAVYPDARVAVTHRDPLVLLTSLTSLIANLRFAHSDAVDFAEIGAEHAGTWTRTFDNLVDWTDGAVLPEPQLHHSHFADFLDEPIAVVDGLYARFGLELGEESRDAIARALAERPRDARGEHRYDFDDLELDAGDLRARFERYFRRFDVLEKG